MVVTLRLGYFLIICSRGIASRFVMLCDTEGCELNMTIKQKKRQKVVNKTTVAASNFLARKASKGEQF